MPRFAAIERLRASPRDAAANDNSANSIYAYSSDVEDLLRRLYESGHPPRNTRFTFDRLGPRRVVRAASAIALVCCIAACAAVIFSLKSPHEDIRPLAKEQLAPKSDRLALVATVIGGSSPVDDAELSGSLRPDADSIDPIRGSIAEVFRTADRPVQPVSRKQHQKRSTDRIPLPTRVTASASPPPRSASFFETVFGLRSLFGQSSPQT